MELLALREEAELGTPHARSELGTGRPKADQDYMAGLMVELRG